MYYSEIHDYKKDKYINNTCFLFSYYFSLIENNEYKQFNEKHLVTSKNYVKRQTKITRRLYITKNMYIFIKITSF